MDELRQAVERSQALTQRALGQVDDLIKIGWKAVEVCARLKDENRRLKAALQVADTQLAVSISAFAGHDLTNHEVLRDEGRKVRDTYRALLRELGED